MNKIEIIFFGGFIIFMGIIFPWGLYEDLYAFSVGDWCYKYEVSKQQSLVINEEYYGLKCVEQRIDEIDRLMNNER